MTTLTTQPSTSISGINGGLSSIGRRLRGLIFSQEFILMMVLIGLSLIFTAVNPRFARERNISDILLNSSYIAVAAVGMSMVIISGNIDISVGSMIGVLATISGTLSTQGVPVILCWLAPLLIGPMIGAVTGFFVAYMRIPAIVVTLGMMSILQGGLIIATGGVKTGSDVARALALGASAAGIARPALQALKEGGREGAVRFFEDIERELRALMLLTGSRTVRELSRAPKMITGALREWRELLAG